MKNLALIFTFLILSMSCNDNEKTLKKKEVISKSVTKKNQKTDSETDLIKFEPKISFSDYQVNVEKVNVKPNLNSHELGNQFRSAIREDFEKIESLFAGHYTLAYWGCGSPCQVSVLIDRRTGKIYDGPTASLGNKFQKNSRMLIVNPPDSLGYYKKDCPYCIPEIYILNEDTKKFERIKP